MGQRSDANCMVQLGMPIGSSTGGTFAGASTSYMGNTIEYVPGEMHYSEVLPRDVLISSGECRLIEVLSRQ